MQSSKTSRMVQISMLAAIEVVLAFTPLGYIPLGVIRATTIHIPVILGGILLGPAAGGMLGFVFGLTSLWTNTFSPTLTSFAFSPFYQVGEYGGNIYSLVICFVPRILIGIFASYAFKLAMKLTKSGFISSAAAGLIGSMTNTALVMGGIYVFFGEQYAGAKGMPISELGAFIMGVVGVNGVLEGIAALLITAVVAKPLLKIIHK